MPSGHAYSADSLLMERMAAHVENVHAPADSASLRERAEELGQQADTLRQMVTSGVAPVNAEVTRE